MGRADSSYFDKANAIVDFFENPCDAPWLLYLETLRQPAGQAALELLTFDMCDILRCMLRPKGLPVAGYRRSKRGARRRRTDLLPGIELLCKQVADPVGWNKREVSAGVRTLWAVDGILQRGLFWWMLADVGLDFFYNWTSAIQRSEYCSRSRSGSAMYHSDGYLANWHAAYPPGEIVVDYSNPPVTTGVTGGFGVEAGADYTTIAGISYKGGGGVLEDAWWSVTPGSNIPMNLESVDNGKGTIGMIAKSDNVRLEAGTSLVPMFKFTYFTEVVTAICSVQASLTPTKPPGFGVNDFLCGVPGLFEDVFGE